MTRDSQVWFVAKGLGAFFAFLVAFLSVSSYFGGGILGIGISVLLAFAVAFGLVIARPQFRESVPIVREKPVVRKTSATLSNRPCHLGPYDVVLGKPTKIPLSVKEGDTIDGYVAEVDGYSFNWRIVDEENLIRYLNEARVNPLEDDEDVPASKVNCRVPHDGPWYLVLDVFGKQITREVEVNLRVL